MAASIEQQVHLAGTVAHHDHRTPPDALQAEIAGVRHLPPMPDEDPGAMKDVLELIGKNLRVGVKPRMHPVGLHQRAIIDFRPRHCSGVPEIAIR
jgi:hypothetical protein